MEKIQIWVEQLVTACGVTGDTVDFVTHTVLVVVAFLLAAIAGWICRRAVVPVLLRLAAKTEAKWDDVLFNKRVLLAASSIVPAIVIWQLLPWTFFDFPSVREVLTRLTAIYITVMATRTVTAFIDSFKLLEKGPRSARQQYLYSICGVLKIIIIFIAVIVVIAIVVDKDPSTLFAGLGAASAILMLAFQDTIKGLVAGIRLTNNDMVHIGDWITVTAAGVNGRVEDISLTTVKVRNFDNTIVTVTPQTLVDGSFQNWLGMEQNEGRKQTRKIYFDFRSIRLDDEGVANITKFRHHVEQWLRDNPKVIADKNPLVRQAEATQGGCCLEFTFWLYAQAWADFEHDTADIMEYIFAASADYGLTIYQQFPLQQD
jgi:miniconductance mechanosensitive channel